MAFLQHPVMYVDVTDITEDGHIVGIEEVAVVIVIASFCGHCNSMKPAIQEVADKNPSKKVLVIHADGKTKGDVDIGKKVGKHLKIPGYPHIAMTTKHGKIVDTIKPVGRSVKDLEGVLGKK
jgi:thiol-disulfide isomerase/thioredoxin